MHGEHLRWPGGASPPALEGEATAGTKRCSCRSFKRTRASWPQCKVIHPTPAQAAGRCFPAQLPVDLHCALFVLAGARGPVALRVRDHPRPGRRGRSRRSRCPLAPSASEESALLEDYELGMQVAAV